MIFSDSTILCDIASVRFIIYANKNKSGVFSKGIHRVHFVYNYLNKNPFSSKEMSVE